MDFLAGLNYPAAHQGLDIGGNARFPSNILCEGQQSPLVSDDWISTNMISTLQLNSGKG